MKIEAENKELVLRSKEGHMAILPVTHRKKALSYLEEGNDKELNKLIQGLPVMEDYADEGTVITPIMGDPPNEPVKTDTNPPLNTLSGAFTPENMFYRDIAQNENYETLGKRKASIEEVQLVKDRYKNIYGDKVPLEELKNIAEKTKRRANVMYQLNTESNKKASEYTDIDFTPQIDKAIEHFKKNYGKTTKDFYSVESDLAGFKATPIPREIYNRIVKSAEAIGMDKYTALGLAMVESNFGKGYRDKKSNVYESGIFSNYDGKSWPKDKELDLNKGYSSAALDYVNTKNIDFSNLSEVDSSKVVNEFKTKLQSIKPLAKTGAEAALLYYKKNPQGYNSGNKKYVQTVDQAANTLRNQKDKLEAWEKMME